MACFNTTKSCTVDPHLSRKGSGFEIILDDEPQLYFGSDQEFSAFVKDLRMFGEEAKYATKITSLFVHGKFLTGVAEDRQIQLFESLPHLEELHVLSANISVRTVLVCLRQTQRLRHLCFDKAVLVCNAKTIDRDQIQFCEELQRQTSLKEFHLSLAPAPSTSSFDIPMFVGEGQMIDPLFRGLASIKSLRSVYVSFHQMGQGRIVDPLALGTAARSVEELTLKNCPLNKLHCESFASRTEPSSLKVLTLIDSCLGDEGVASLAKSLNSSQTSLKKLHLPGNNIGKRGVLAIKNYLQDTSTVLDLHDNSLSTEAASVLSDMLVTDKTALRYLDLSGNTLGDEGCMALTALANNAKLEQLYLLDCDLSNKSCEIFARVLRKNRTLKRLNLYSNSNIDGAGVESIARSLKENFVFEWLMIRPSAAYGDFDFFPRLNRVFRREELLSASTSERDFTEKGLIKACTEDDLSALFYLLNSKPSIIPFSAPKKQGPLEPRKIVISSLASTPTRELYPNTKYLALPSQPRLLSFFSTPKMAGNRQA